MPVPYELTSDYVTDITYWDSTITTHGSDTNAWTVRLYMGYVKGGVLIAQMVNDPHTFTGYMSSPPTARPTLGGELWLEFDWSGPGAINVQYGEFLRLNFNSGAKLYLELPDINSAAYGTTTSKKFLMSKDGGTTIGAVFNLATDSKGNEVMAFGSPAIGGDIFSESVGMSETVGRGAMNELLDTVKVSEETDRRGFEWVNQKVYAREIAEVGSYMEVNQSVLLSSPVTILDNRTKKYRTVRVTS